MSSDINQLISKHLKGELSKDEELKLNEWINQKVSNEEQLRALEKIWQTPMGYPDIINMEDQKKILWDRLNGGSGQSKPETTKHVNLFARFYKYAAAAVVLLAIGLYVYSTNQPVVTPEVEIAQLWVVKENPNGVKSQIQLPDGTHVWLNAASRISYQRGFSDTARLVRLTGEAFFDVVKDKTRPFRVTAGEVITTALGTSFNINSYQTNEVQVSLVTGKVEVTRNDNNQRVFLNPGEQVFSGGSGLEVGEFFQDKDLAWKSGVLYFDNTNFDEMVKVLEKWYDVKFKIEGMSQAQKSMKAVGQFKDESLENVLKVLSHSMKFDFNINKNIVKIKPRKKV